MGKVISTWNDKLQGREFIRIAFLHLAPRYDDIQYNLLLLEKLFLKAVEHQADLILTPELAVSGYEFYKILGKEWIKTDGHAIIEQFSQFTRENNVALVLGCPVYDEANEKYYNAAIFIDEYGHVIGAHHKISVLLHGVEAWSDPGTEIKPVEWHGQKIGLLICADAYPAYIAAELAKQGAKVLLSSAAWAPGMHGPNGEWEQRSKDTGLCFFICNRTGRGAVVNFEGSSSTIAFNGHRIVEYADEQPAILTIDVDTVSWFPKSKSFNILREI